MICATLVLYLLAIRQSESPLRTRYSIRSTVVVVLTAEFAAIVGISSRCPILMRSPEIPFAARNCARVIPIVCAISQSESPRRTRYSRFESVRAAT